MPKLSIITINLNNLAGLQKTMESVFSQTFTDYEYIIIDGGSTDGSKEYIEHHSDKLAYWVCEPDGGIYQGMNKGILKSNGDMVCFLNSGDFYVSSSLFKELVDSLQPIHASVFFGKFIWEEPNNDEVVISDHSCIRYHWDFRERNFPHPATIYRRSAFNKVGLFDENYKILGDYDWNARALIQYRLPFYYFSIVTAHFIAEGISMNKRFAVQRQKEQDIINSTYFKPTRLFFLVKKLKNIKGERFYKVILAFIFRKKLNKVSQKSLVLF